ncbi:MAG TPA: TadE/TadG family type IV pilus assembly protein [Pyrinomonadaceae bacterium]|jgi:hypothetical protein|nr:TadE/TadG family type IV pilus assembly protein [Pyrinomonadaceae bacterium]
MNTQNDSNQRGSVTTEFVLVVPLLVVAMLFLMGLGYTLMTKQNAIVGARAAVYYRAPRSQTPPVTTVNALIKDAVSPAREEWTLDFSEGNLANPDTGQSILQSGVNSIYQSFNKEIRYTANGTATLGFLPSIMELGQAQGRYALPHRTWTCEQTGGSSYLSITLSSVGLSSRLSNLVGLSCCETYKASYR